MNQKQEPLPKPDYTIGLDLGQAKDYSALAILKREWKRSPIPENPGRLLSHFALVHLKRWPLHTSYPQIVAELAKMVQTRPLDYPLLAVDQTGVGAAVVDMITEAQVRASLRAIVITAGHQVTCESALCVPKKELVSTVQVLLQDKRLKIANVPDRDILVKELVNFKVKITVAANETFEAWRERDHDDMVLAVALAAWLAEYHGAGNAGIFSIPNPPRRELFGRGPGSSWREQFVDN